MKLFPSELSPATSPVIVFEAYEDPKGTADESIFLPFPKNMSLGDSAAFGAIELTGITKGAADILDGNISGTVTGILEAMAATAAGAASVLPGLDKLTSALSHRAGVVQNKRETTVFNQMGIRSFSFDFSFIPESAADSDTLRSIELAFRKYMYPDVKEIFGLIGLKYPALWNIKALGSYKKYYSLPLKKGVFLETMSISYGSGNSFAKFKATGAPTQVNFTLSFKEAKALTREDIKNG